MKNIFKNTPLLFGFCLYTVIFMELYLRVIAPQAIVPRYVTAAPYGIRMNEPGRTYAQVTPETRVSIEVNAQGMRAVTEYPLEKPKNTSRIAIFGDSYFMGYEANMQDSFAWHLENGLKQKGCKVEVLNFAVSGFGTAEMIRTLSEKGLPFDPDVVLFQWHHTDPADNLRSGLFAMEDNILVETGNNYIPIVRTREMLERIPFYDVISAHSHLYAASREKISRAIKNFKTGGALVNEAHQKEGQVLNQPAGPLTRPPASPLDIALLQEAEARSLKVDAAFYVVDIPSVESRMKFLSGFRLLPNELKDRTNYLSPLSAFDAAASPKEKLYWEKGHRHLTPKGNKLLATMVQKNLHASAFGKLSCGDVPLIVAGKE